MRRAIEAWGRERWPDARLVHELVVAQERRIDMAFIQPGNIVGIEIKSSRDTLDRLDESDSAGGMRGGRPARPDGGRERPRRATVGRAGTVQFR